MKKHKIVWYCYYEVINPLSNCRYYISTLYDIFELVPSNWTINQLTPNEFYNRKHINNTDKIYFEEEE